MFEYFFQMQESDHIVRRAICWCFLVRVRRFERRTFAAGHGQRIRLRKRNSESAADDVPGE
ncbi:MAG: hypothetical protein BWK76_09500 [Desulfobulbaceae bacterium A2]|nr:MAG: hypothetical protein BWK76_09500 [Desulfobulbaceae bacterium A2]